MVLVPTITLIAERRRLLGRAAHADPRPRLFDFLAFLPLAIPAIVFSVAALLLALFVLRDVVPIYGTIWILVLVYVVARLCYGTRMTNSAPHPDPPRARGIGAGLRRRHRRRAARACCVPLLGAVARSMPGSGSRS